MSFRVKGAFIIGILMGSSLYWALHPEELPGVFVVKPSDIEFSFPLDFKEDNIYSILRLVGDLLFIGILQAQ